MYVETTRIYDPQYGAVFTAAMTAVLEDDIKNGDDDANIILSAVAEISKEHFPSRLALDEVLMEWREFARAPIASSQRPDLWA